MGRGLLILHIDGVGHRFLTRAIAAGRMPHVARLIANEGYEPLEYHCGIPSTTPFCQAGILYGDNHEIYISGRLNASELDRRFPGLLEKVAGVDRVAFVLVADGSEGTLVSAQGRQPLTGPGAAPVLSRYDPETDLLVQQLTRLNSYQRSGDMIIFGQVNDGIHINFKHQVGGHGAIGGDQVWPFLLVKREWGIDTRAVKGASDLYPILRDLRDRLRAGPAAPAGPDPVSGSRKT